MPILREQRSRWLTHNAKILFFASDKIQEFDYNKTNETQFLNLNEYFMNTNVIACIVSAELDE